MTVYFDMDGTIADLYGVENWLEKLRASNATPYADAEPMVNIEQFTLSILAIQKQGYEVGVISWTSKNGTSNYNKAVRSVKRAWLKATFPEIKFDEIHIVKYGTPKSKFATSNNDILFDDEEQNRENWKGEAYEPTEIARVLEELARNV